MAMASENKTEEMVTLCRQLREVWGENLANTGGGSFRYWSGRRMVYGINISGQLGELDI